MNRELLERPFEAALIKTRKGAFGQQLSYVEGAEYVRRLNCSFDGRWSFEIVDHQVGKNHVVVVGKLTAGEIVKMAFGGSSITTNNQTGEAVSIADDLKSAATDALKKSASLLGIGLHLYQDNGVAQKGIPRESAPSRSNGGNGKNEREKPQEHPKQERRRSRINRRNGPAGKNERSNPKVPSDYDRSPSDPVNSQGRNGVQPRPPLTSSQFNAIRAIARSREISNEELLRRSVEAFGVVPDRLTKIDASSLIKTLKAIPAPNHRDAS